MGTLPKNIKEVIEIFRPAFNFHSYQRFTFLLISAILTTGSRTVSNLLRTIQFCVEGDSSSYHRFFSKRKWSLENLSYLLINLILKRYNPNDVIYLIGDDTVDEHPGRSVYGKAKHRDAIRSSHKFTAHIWGHKWVVLSVLVSFPFSKRPWALPIMAALYTPPEISKKLGKKHRTPCEIMRVLLTLVIRWFPERKFIFCGDGGYAVHSLARFCKRHGIELVSKFYANASLFKLPKSKNGAGRPRVKGDKLPTPETIVNITRKRTKLTVNWYGGQKRVVETVTGTGYWYKSGDGLVKVRWVFVHDLTGTHRDEYFFSTNINVSIKHIIETYTGRWSLEVTFEEARSYVGFGTTRSYVQNSILRQAPCLLGLYSIVALLFEQLPSSYQRQYVQWIGKSQITFADAITAVRRWLWRKWIFETLDKTKALQKLSKKFQQTLLYSLAPTS